MCYKLSRNVHVQLSLLYGSVHFCMLVLDWKGWKSK